MFKIKNVCKLIDLSKILDVKKMGSFIKDNYKMKEVDVTEEMIKRVKEKNKKREEEFNQKYPSGLDEEGQPFFPSIRSEKYTSKVIDEIHLAQIIIKNINECVKDK